MRRRVCGYFYYFVDFIDYFYYFVDFIDYFFRHDWVEPQESAKKGTGDQGKEEAGQEWLRER